MPLSPVNEILSLDFQSIETAAVLKPGDVFVVTGPNGVGKSAFLAEINAPSGVIVERFFGSRQILFSQDSHQASEPMADLMSYLRNNANRFYNPWSESHFKSVIRRILDKQLQQSIDMISAMRSGANYEIAETRHPQPLSEINACFAMAKLTVQMDIIDGRLVAKNNGVTYGIERMSDGERAALLLVGAILVQPSNGYLLIDEPERHLNPSISGPLISSAVRKRPDLGFLFTTHDLNLISWLRPTKIIHLQKSVLDHAGKDSRSYDCAILDGLEEISENLRYGLLGSRQALLLVEGSATSEDKLLYSLAYPDWNVLPREGWESVANGVKALNDNGAYHWLRVVGIIDGDGRDPTEVAALAAKQIFALSSPTIENIFLQRPIVEQMAAAAEVLFGAPPSAAERLERVEAEVRGLLERHRVDIISRRVAWIANRLLSESKVSVDSIKNNQAEIAAIPLDPLRENVIAEFDSAMANVSVFDIVSRIPIKNTGVPAAIAKAIGFNSYGQYARAVLNQVERGTSFGDSIIESVRSSLPTLPLIE